MKSEMKKNFSMKRLESLKNLEINGINLLQLENENESKIPGKKKLYKQILLIFKPQIKMNFIENIQK